MTGLFSQTKDPRTERMTETNDNQLEIVKPSAGAVVRFKRIERGEEEAPKGPGKGVPALMLRMKEPANG